MATPCLELSQPPPLAKTYMKAKQTRRRDAVESRFERGLPKPFCFLFPFVFLTHV